MIPVLVLMVPWVVAAAMGLAMFRRPAVGRSTQRSGGQRSARSTLGPGLADDRGPSARTRLRRHRQMPSDDLPQLADLLAVGLSAGLTIRLALLSVADLPNPPAASFVRSAAEDLRTGKGLAVALGGLHGDGSESADRAHDERLSGLSAVLIVADRAGAGAVGVLGRYAEHERQLCRRAREERLRRLPVRLLPPLVVCVLPAFVLCTIVPIAVAVGRSLRFPG